MLKFFNTLLIPPTSSLITSFVQKRSTWTDRCTISQAVCMAHTSCSTRRGRTWIRASQRRFVIVSSHHQMVKYVEGLVKLNWKSMTPDFENSRPSQKISLKLKWRKLISSFDKEVLLTTLEDYLTPLPKPDGIIYLKRSAKYCCEKVEEEPHDSHHQDEV